MKQDPREGCRCESPGHHALLVARVDRSFEQDRDRALLAQKVATSEALRIRALAPTNGHSRIEVREGHVIFEEGGSDV